MPDEQIFSSCPLLTAYATDEKLKADVRPFAAINGDTLERLFIIRQWPIEAATNPIPLKVPDNVRQFHYDPFSRSLTDTPLVIKEFQKQAILHLIKMPRFILGDAVGLGKTLDSLVAFAWLKAKNPKAKMIVITTKSTTYQWSDECEKYTALRPKVMTDSYHGLKGSNARYAQMRDFLQDDEHDVLVTKYDSLKGHRKIVTEDGEKKRQKESEETTFYKGMIKDHHQNIVLTLDECHRFRATGTQTRHFISRICRYPERVWALTATAIKNGLDEFYSIAVAIGVSPLGSMNEFWAEYCIWREQPIGQGRTIRLISGYQNVAHFKEQLRPFFLGRSQKQVKEKLPALSTVYHPIDLDEKQAKLLVEIPMGLIELPPIFFKVAGEIFQKERDPSNEMTQLSCQQLVANHWALLDRNNPETFLTPKLSPKEDALLDMLDGEYRGEKVVVYTKYRSWIDRLEWLTANGKFTDRKFLRITGAENETKRNENKRKFQDPNSGYDLIVINAAGMEGINLQSAAHMITLDVPWSWGDLIQLVGRMVRMASPHSLCTLHVMVAKGTIDEYAVETLKGKKGIFEAVLGQTHSAGILDDASAFDLTSGMDAFGSDEDFHAMLRVHAKKYSMTKFVAGERLTKAVGDEDYLMSFQQTKVEKPKKKKDGHEELFKQWGGDTVL